MKYRLVRDRSVRGVYYASPGHNRNNDVEVSISLQSNLGARIDSSAVRVINRDLLSVVDGFTDTLRSLSNDDDYVGFSISSVDLTSGDPEWIVPNNYYMAGVFAARELLLDRNNWSSAE